MTKGDREFLKECAYESAKDDFENLPTLIKDVADWAKDEGRPWEEQEFIEALEELIGSGKVLVYEYAPEKRDYIPVRFDKNRIDQLWFRSRRPV